MYVIQVKWYSHFKQTFDHQCEQYLRYIDNPKYRRALCQFRVSSHVLEIEQGRYHGIPREQQLCKFCSSNLVDDEYHFLLACPMYRQHRLKYLPRYCWSFVSILNF